MKLNNREKTIALVSNAIAAYSIYAEQGKLPENPSLIDFIVKAIPSDLKSDLSMDLVDEIYEYVSKVGLQR